MKKLLSSFQGEVPSDQISAPEEAYRSMTSALSEADGIDSSDPQEWCISLGTQTLQTSIQDLEPDDDQQYKPAGVKFPYRAFAVLSGYMVNGELMVVDEVIGASDVFEESISMR